MEAEEQRRPGNINHKNDARWMRGDYACIIHLGASLAAVKWSSPECQESGLTVEHLNGWWTEQRSPEPTGSHLGTLTSTWHHSCDWCFQACPYFWFCVYEHNYLLLYCTAYHALLLST